MARHLAGCAVHRGGLIAPAKPPGSVLGADLGVRSVRAGRPGARAGTTGIAHRAGATRVRRLRRAARGAGRGEVGSARCRARRGVREPAATILRTRGLEVEAPLAFAALHGLLRPVLRLREGLPAPQARALRVAFGEEDGPAVEPFLVGVATLSVLAAAAEEHLVLCVIDDAHWLDAASADALLFSARRLGADRVAMLFAARDASRVAFEPDGIPELVVSGLDPEAAATSCRSAWWRAHTGGHRATRGGDAGQPARPAGATRRAEPGPVARLGELPAHLHLTLMSSRRSSTAADGCPHLRSRCCCSRLPTTPVTWLFCDGHPLRLGRTERRCRQPWQAAF